MLARQEQNDNSTSIIAAALKRQKISKYTLSAERKQYLDDRLLPETIDYTQLSNSDLVYIISESEAASKCKYHAYLHMIKSGDLDDLQSLAQYMDFQHVSAMGRHCVLQACHFGRRDVLRWLVEDLHLSLDVKDNECDGPQELAITKGHTQLLYDLVKPREMGGYGLKLKATSLNVNQNPVTCAILNDQPELLHELVKPVEQGGFGLTLNVRDNFNFDVTMAAIDSHSWKTLRELIKPVSLGGFGCMLDSNVLKNHPYPSTLTSLQYPRYVMSIDRSENSKNHKETLNIFDVETGTVTPYVIGVLMGAGGYGGVYKFTNSESGKSFAVKVPRGNWSVLDNPLEYEYRSRAMAQEYHYLCKAYPEYGPYMFQEMRRYDEKKFYYTHRIAMPVISGDTISKVFAALKAPREQALLILRVAEEVNKLHSNGMIHGDIRHGNILVKKTDTNDFDVRLIDFGFSKTIGEEMFTGRRDTLFAPEAEVQFSIARSAIDVWSLSALFSEYGINFVALYKEFPGIKQFIEAGQNKNPLARPSLPEFIKELEQVLDGRPEHGYSARKIA